METVIAFLHSSTFFGILGILFSLNLILLISNAFKLKRIEKLFNNINHEDLFFKEFEIVIGLVLDASHAEWHDCSIYLSFLQSDLKNNSFSIDIAQEEKIRQVVRQYFYTVSFSQYSLFDLNTMIQKHLEFPFPLVRLRLQ